MKRVSVSLKAGSIEMIREAQKKDGEEKKKKRNGTSVACGTISSGFKCVVGDPKKRVERE